MKNLFTRTLIWVVAFFFLSFGTSLNAEAANSNIYESLTGTNGSAMNSVAGSSDSVGLTGNWITVPGQKTGTCCFGASIFTNSYNTKLAFPTNSNLTIPASNTAAGTSINAWTVFNSARVITSPISFDANDTYYFSFLMYAPVDGSNNWGSSVVGLFDGLPSSSSDTTKKSLYFGRTYGGTPIIRLATANIPVWESGGTVANGSSANPIAPGDKSWFVIVKITTASSGNDTVQIKLFSPAGTIPTTESGITWDATLSAQISGSWGYLAVQSEYNAIVDEIRGSASYNTVAGLSSPANFGSPTISGVIKKGNSINVSVTVDAPGFVRFSVDGKRIAGCLKVATTGSSPNYTATCAWKPTVQGNKRITASFVSTDSSYLSANSGPALFTVSSRTNNR